MVESMGAFCIRTLWRKHSGDSRRLRLYYSLRESSMDCTSHGACVMKECVAECSGRRRSAVFRNEVDLPDGETSAQFGEVGMTLGAAKLTILS